MPQEIDGILDAEEEKQASDVFLQEDEAPRLKEMPARRDPNSIQGGNRYWLHIALARDDRAVLGMQLEEVG